MAKLLKDLHLLGLKSKDLQDLKVSLLAASSRLETSKELLLGFKSERRKLEDERQYHISALKQIQDDLQQLDEAASKHEKKNLEVHDEVTRLRTAHAELKDIVDDHRQQHSLPKLPNVQEEMDTAVGSYLQERREKFLQQIQSNNKPLKLGRANQKMKGGGNVPRISFVFDVAATETPSNSEPQSPAKRKRGRPRLSSQEEKRSRR